jgi:hypothetical protein
MSDEGFMVSAAAFDAPKGYQMVKSTLPSKEVLQAIGRAAVRLGQLEHLLKQIYKRSDKNVSFDDSLDLEFSLGALLNGAHGGKPMEFEGLIHLAKRNQELASVSDQLRRAVGLSPTRKQYLHNGIGENSHGEFVFMASGRTIGESTMCAELNKASTLAESFFLEINTKIPPKMEE